MPEKQKFLYKEINEMVDKEELLNSSLHHEIKIYSQTVYVNQIPCSNVFTREIIVYKINTRTSSGPIFCEHELQDLSGCLKMDYFN